MTDIEMLRDKIKSSGFTIGFIARKLMISRQALYRRLRGAVEFRQSEIAILIDLLDLSRKEEKQIFYARVLTKR